ncbi:prepilin-type N-terminal cleavage/methylation domain-containing protein [Niallia sp. Krafla_26]|uniref:prepilin-type N-terminal cleavage/methylation domain-containing protein n=1 Tax=Niallia sp. Krafla_26 TaxID=3064703 RepID=UPI003D179C35
MKLIKKLLNSKMKFAKNQKGLTLIELLVVIVILGIIAAIAIPAIANQSSKARESAVEQTNSIVKDAVQRYIAVEETYTAGDAVTLKDLMDEKLLQDIPSCPEGSTINVTNTESNGSVTADSTTDLLGVNYCELN